MADRRTSILEAACRVVARRGVRGLRIEELAQEAGVSLALVYYYFADRAELLQRTLQFVSERADRYTERALPQSVRGARRVEQMLLLELQDDPTVRENSAAWAELRASAIFEPSLREPLEAATRVWIDDVARAFDENGLAPGDSQAAAERLTALVEGLSHRWLSETVSLERARQLVSDAVARELAPPPAA